MTKGLAPGAVLDAVALFPLPSVVLFPGALLPLHVFEPRYRTMIEQVLAGSRRLSVVLIVEGGKNDEHGHPPIVEVAGLGEIIGHQKLPDGRYHMVLRGVARVRLEELPFEPPYRRARATVLGSTGPKPSQSELSALLSTAMRFVRQVRQRESSFHFELPDAGDPTAVVDACAQQLVIEASTRQRLLEALDMGERIRGCAEALAVQCALLEPDGASN